MCAYIGWFAEGHNLRDTFWKPSFTLLRDAATERLVRIGKEALTQDALSPAGFEIDDVTRSRNLIVAAAIASSALAGKEAELSGDSSPDALFNFLVSQDRLFVAGECAVPFILIIQIFLEKAHPDLNLFPKISELLSEYYTRNNRHSDDEPFYPPHIELDDILARLFHLEESLPKLRYGNLCRHLELLVEFLVRRDQRQTIEQHWRNISHLQFSSFIPEHPKDILTWRSETGVEDSRNPPEEVSWRALKERSSNHNYDQLPKAITSDPVFALYFSMVFPHRFNSALSALLDERFKEASGRGFST